MADEYNAERNQCYIKNQLSGTILLYITWLDPNVAPIKI